MYAIKHSETERTHKQNTSYALRCGTIQLRQVIRIEHYSSALATTHTHKHDIAPTQPTTGGSRRRHRGNVWVQLC